MAETPEDFAVHRFVLDLFEDLSLTLPSLGCAFEGFVTPQALTARGPAQSLKNKLFLLFADLATVSPQLTVRFQPTVQGSDLVMSFLCTPFEVAVASLPGWDAGLFEAFHTEEISGFRLVLPAGRPLEIGPPLHWHQLAQLYGGAANGLQVLDHFIKRSKALLSDLENAISTHDSAKLMRAAHTLKGSARGVTAHGLAEAAFQLEMLGRSGDLQAATDLYKALLVTYDEFILWVRKGQK